MREETSKIDRRGCLTSLLDYLLTVFIVLPPFFLYRKVLGTLIEKKEVELLEERQESFDLGVGLPEDVLEAMIEKEELSWDNPKEANQIRKLNAYRSMCLNGVYWRRHKEYIPPKEANRLLKLYGWK